MQLAISMVLQEVIDHYNLQNIVIEDGWIYCEIRKAICELKELGRLANIELQTVLVSEGYKPCHFTHRLYKHEKQNITFSLVVDNFGVQHRNTR